MKSMRIFVFLILTITCVASGYAQTCNDAIVATTPISRFVDNADGTVTDSATGLIWKRCSEGQSWNGTTCTGSATTLAWQAALQAGSDAVFAGASDWRLPNKNELASLVESRCIDPAINTTIFPATPSSYFWSSSPARNVFSAWYVDFYYGDVYYADGDKSSKNYSLRLVRGGE